MAYAFDTLGYAKRLREAGVVNEHAEVHAEAAREFIMTELVTKPDLQAVKSELRSELQALKSELQMAIDAQTLRLTVRIGGIVAVGVGMLAALMGVLAFFLRLR